MEKECTITLNEPECRMMGAALGALVYTSTVVQGHIPEEPEFATLMAKFEQAIQTGGINVGTHQ